MKVNIQKIVVAGIVGTLTMTILMLIAPMMGFPPMDMGKMLGNMNPIVAMPYALGWMMHFVIGVVLTAIYALVFIRILPSKGWKRGLIYSLFPFLLAQIMVMPVMGMGFFTGGNIPAILGSLLGHLVYGGVMGAIYTEQ